MSEEIKTNWWKCDNCGKTHIGIEKAHECELSHTIDKQRVLDAINKWLKIKNPEDVGLEKYADALDFKLTIESFMKELELEAEKQ